jgi:hypothetical protein
MKVWTLLVASTFLTLFLIARWTLSMKRGAGPQGGEILFLCWLALFMWVVLISVSSAIGYVTGHPGGGALRSVGIPLATAVATIILCCVIATLLNNASLSDITELQSRLQNWSAFLLYALLVAANLWFIVRR